MSITEKKSNYREDFPGYQGFIHYKYGIIGKNVGARNKAIKSLLTNEPPKEAIIKQVQNDFSHYNRDYYTNNFDRSYPLEEEKIFTNKSRNAKTWISGDKYSIYPQHIPNLQTHIPGIYSSNIYGLSFSRASALAIKGDYSKGSDCSNKERFKSTNQITYQIPKIIIKEKENNLNQEPTFKGGNKLSQSVDKLYKIYHSKIAKIPTVGYTGCANVNIFQKPVGYLNYNKIIEKEKIIREGKQKANYENLPIKFQEALNIRKPDIDLPYISGYKGHKIGLKSKGLYGASTHELALKSINESFPDLFETQSKKKFNINFNLYYPLLIPNCFMQINFKEIPKGLDIIDENWEKPIKMEFNKDKIISKNGIELSGFWSVIINFINNINDNNYLDIEYKYSLFNTKTNTTILERGPNRKLIILLNGKENNKEILDVNFVFPFDYDQVGDKNIFIGSYLQNEADFESISKKGINTILNVQTDKDLENHKLDINILNKYANKYGIEIKRYPIGDFNKEDLSNKLKGAVDLLYQLIKEGKKVYVHCTAGIGRSANVVICYLVLYENYSVKDAVELCKKSRPKIRPIYDAINNIVKRYKNNSEI